VRYEGGLKAELGAGLGWSKIYQLAPVRWLLQGSKVICYQRKVFVFQITAE